MQKQKQGISFLTGVFVLLFGLGSYFGVASMYQSANPGMFPVVLGDDDDDKDEDEDKDDDKDDDEDKDDDKDEKKSESDKKKAEREREDTKKQAERVRETSKKSAEQSGRGGDDSDEEDDDSDIEENDEDEFEDDEEDDDRSGSEDFSGMYKEKDKTLSKLQEEIAKAEEDIMKQQSKGADVTVALANLAIAKASISQVGTSFDANNFETAKLLAKQIKKAAHFAEKDAKDAEHVAKELADVEKRFGQVEEKIGKLEAIGGDASSFKSQLASLRADFTVLKGSVSLITRDTAKAFEKRVKRLKSAVETAIFALGGRDDDDLADDHDDDADELDDDLNDVAEIEDGDDNGVSGKLRKVAAEHKSSVAVVATTLGDIKRRDGFARALFGPDFSALDRLNTEVAAMNTRADAIEASAAQIADPQVKQILIDQATSLRTQVSKLSAYVVAEDNQFSLLGGLMKLFR